MLADPNVGLGPVIDNFFGALQDVSNNPGSMPEREVLLGEAQALADRFHYLDSNFRNISSEVNARLELSVSEINSLAANIAELNQQISSASAQAGGKPNDLLDQRDQLLVELSAKVNVTTV